MAKFFDTFNLEEGMPTLEEARKKLAMYLLDAKRKGIVVTKIIHGYGSSGVGGTLRVGIRKSLALRKQDKTILEFVTGEQWSIFDEASRRILDKCAELSRDSDLEKHNNGITLVLLK